MRRAFATQFDSFCSCRLAAVEFHGMVSFCDMLLAGLSIDPELSHKYLLRQTAVIHIYLCMIEK